MKLSLTRLFFLSLFFITAGLQLSAQEKQGYAYASVGIKPSVNAAYPNTAVTATDNTAKS